MAARYQPATSSRLSAWFAAVDASDTRLLEEFIAHGLPIDIPHPLRHSTALMEATRRGRTNLVHWLLEHGAAPGFLCGQPVGTALHCALRHRYWEIVRLLLTRLNDCAVTDAYGATPLHLLCTEPCEGRDAEESLAIAHTLIEHHCPLDAADQDGTTALHHCVINDLREMAHLLLNHGANPDALVPDSRVSPLMIAALEQNTNMARLLLAHGANPNLKTKSGTSPATLYPTIAELITESDMLPMIPLGLIGQEMVG